MTEAEMRRQLEQMAAKWNGRKHLEELDMFVNRDLIFQLLEFIRER
jgi:hypothetical protein